MAELDNAPLKPRPAWETDFPHERVEATHVSRREFAKFLCLVSGGLTAGTAFVAVKDKLLPPHRRLPQLAVVLRGEEIFVRALETPPRA